MSKTTRKYAWPVSAAMAFALVAALAAFIVLGGSPGVAVAHAPDTDHGAACPTGDSVDDIVDRATHDALSEDPNADGDTSDAITNADGTAHSCDNPGTPAGTGNGGNGGSSGDTIKSSSTSGGAGVELILTIDSLTVSAVDGSSVELYLEDDFQVPDTIDRGSVYFTVSNRDGSRVSNDQNNGGRVYAQYAVEIDDSDHFTENKDDYSIRVFIPDMNNAEDSGYDGPVAGQTVNLVFTKAAGIKNPTEAGTHSVGYSVLGANDEANDGPMYSTKSGDAMQSLDDDGDPLNDKVDLAMHDSTASESVGLKTLAKISLSDEDAGRGKEITITGSGFNNGTGAEVFVFVSNDKPDDCKTLIGNAKTGKLDTKDSKGKVEERHSLGKAEVGSDDKFVVTYTAHQDEFNAGPVNHICAADAEAGATRYSSDIDTFDLEPSVTVSPDSASFGDEVTVKPRDFMRDISMITLGPTCSWTTDGGDDNCFSTSKDKDGNYEFELPGGLDERIQIAVTDADGDYKGDTKRIYMGVVASSLDLSQTEVAPNASIIISGSGFTENSKILVSNITIDDDPLVVDDAGTEDTGADRHVRITSSGEFSATVRVWTASSSGNNPTLDDDTYTIKVVDEGGFEGEVDVTILEPTVTVTPETASPRDYIVISGENWPISTADQDNSVVIEVDGRTRNADIGSTGRFRYEYQLRSTIKIGDEHDVTVTYTDVVANQTRDDIEEEATFSVVQAELSVTPAAAGPGQTISVEIKGMPPYTLVDHVRIDGANRLGGRNVNTDREGDATVDNILVPFLDPGFYPVEVRVGNETRVAQFEVLAEALVPGVAAMLPDAVSGLGDSLEAIFHFNNTSKEWTFFDPRPEFADLNTLTELHAGQPYWVLVDHSHEDVEWNGRLVDFTCAADDCWNLEIW